MPRLSIIIPCLGGAAEFDGTLVSVLQNRPTDCEVLVAHTEPYADPYSLGGEVQFAHLAADSLVELLNAALEATTGEVIHIVGCGLEVSDGWTSTPLKHFDDPDVAAVSPAVVAADRESVVAAGVQWTAAGDRHVINDCRVLSRGSGRLRSKIQGPLLTAAFYRRDVLLAFGGFEAALGDDLADVAMALAIQSLGRLHIAEPASQLTEISSQSQQPSRALAGGRAVERLFCRHAIGRGVAISLLLHPLAVLRDCIRHRALWPIFASLAGRAAAWLEFGDVARYEQRIAEAKERLAELAELRASVRKKPKQKQAKIPATQHRRAA